MRAIGLVVCAVGLMAGCSIGDPTGLREDPELASLGAPLAPSADGEPVRLPRMALAPIALVYRDPSSALSSPSEGSRGDVVSPVSSADAELPYSWSRPPLDAEDLQRTLGLDLAWCLYGGASVVRIGPGDLPPGGVDPAASPDQLRARRVRDLCDAADKQHCALLTTVELVQNRVAWVTRDVWWWADLALFWAGGLIPVALVPDEEYQVELRARVTVYDARTAEPLLAVNDYAGEETRSLSNPQRGWTLTGLVGLRPYFLDADAGDYEPAYRCLVGHAIKKLEVAVAAGLRKALPDALDVPAHRRLLRDGTEATARSYAIVLGYNARRRTVPRSELLFAENDAESVTAALRSSGRIRWRDDLVELIDEAATPAALSSAIAQLAPRILGDDLLVIYFAGYGRTDERGEPLLVLSEQRLELSRLEEWCADSLVRRGNAPRVLFVLDTSFGSQGVGRSYRSVADPGGPAPSSDRYLASLAHRERRWSVLVAAGPDQAAFEIDARTPEARHGFFTSRLLSALDGTAHLGGADRQIRLTELVSYLTDHVPDDVRPTEETDQTPEIRGADDPFVLGLVPEDRAAPPSRGR